MKLNFSLLIIFGILQTYCNAQNPDLFQTWRLSYISVELDSDINVESITPKINTTITIDTNLNFEGDSGCNGYSGLFLYNEDDDTIITQDFSSTLLGCELGSHQEVEDTYYDYLTVFGSQPMTYEIYQNNNEDLELRIDMQIPGFQLFFTNKLLSTNTENLYSFVVYPNPTSNFLNIRTEENISLIIYNTQGRKVFKTENSSSVDVSHLLTGIYFAEISIGNRKSLKKFIKK